MRKASIKDVPLLVTMMAEFYSDSPYTLNSRLATDAFTFLLSDERLGDRVGRLHTRRLRRDR